MKRLPMLSTVALLFAFFISAAQTSAAESAVQPHIIFILADDLGPGDLGGYGGTIAPTPNIDQLAAQGIRFTQYYAASPICSPSRCGLITGQFPARWRITSYLQTRAGNAACEQANYLDPTAPSLPRALQRAGYKTAHIGKWHLGGGRDVVAPPKFAAYGYDEGVGTYESPEPHPDITATDWIWSNEDTVKRWDRTEFFVECTLDFVRRNKDAPCFVNLWLDDPHTPWTPNANASEQPATESRERLKGVMIEVDRQIGRLRAGLRNLGVENSTLIIFASDNGPLPTFSADRTVGLRGSKLSLYEGGIRVPFIAYWPGQTPAGVEDTFTVLAAVDMFPTLCSIAGAPLPADYESDGRDASAALLGNGIGERETALCWEYGRNDTSFKFPEAQRDRSPNLAMRYRQWKLLVNDDGSGAELYDVVADPPETRDLVGEKPELVEQLSRRLLDWRQSVP